MEPLSDRLPLFGSLFLQNCFDNTSPEEKFNAIQLICMRTLEALIAIRDKNLKLFDALVGDQACQIRALKIALISNNDLNIEIKLIENTKNKIIDILNVNKNEKRNLSLKCKENMTANPLKGKEINILFQQEAKKLQEEHKTRLNCNAKKMLEEDVFVKSDVLFIARAYFLTITKLTIRDLKKNTYKNSTKESKIQILNLDCKKIIEKGFFASLKMDLAKGSVDFVKDLANEINFTNCLELKLVKNKRMELPFLYMTEVVFKSAIQKNIPILLKIKNIKEEAFACNIPFGNYEKDSVALIIESYSEKSFVELSSNVFKDTLENEGILNIIKYNSAQHNQYTDQEDLYDENQKALKVMAIEKGFSLSNPLLCCIDHVFCDLMGNQMKDNS